MHRILFQEWIMLTSRLWAQLDKSDNFTRKIVGVVGVYWVSVWWEEKCNNVYPPANQYIAIPFSLSLSLSLSLSTLGTTQISDLLRLTAWAGLVSSVSGVELKALHDVEQQVQVDVRVGLPGRHTEHVLSQGGAGPAAAGLRVQGQPHQAAAREGRGHVGRGRGTVVSQQRLINLDRRGRVRSGEVSGQQWSQAPPATVMASEQRINGSCQGLEASMFYTNL